MSGNADVAHKHYRDVFQNDPGNLFATLGMLATMESGVDLEADLLREKLSQLDAATETHFSIYLAEQLESQGRLRQAMALVRPIVERESNNLAALVVLQRIFRSAGQDRQELSCWLKIENVSDDPRLCLFALTEAASIAQRLSESEEAKALYRRALSYSEREPLLIERLRDLAFQTDDYPLLELLVGYQIKCADTEEMKMALFLERAQLRLKHRSNQRGAIRDLESVLELDGEHMLAHRLLADLYEAQGDISAATFHLQCLVNRANTLEDYRPMVVRLSGLLIRANRPDEASRVCSSFLTHHPGDPEVLRILSQCQVGCGDYRAAVVSLRRIAEESHRDEERTSALTEAAHYCRVNLEDPALAAQCLMDAHRIAPDNLKIVRDLLRVADYLTERNEVDRCVSAAAERVLARLKQDPFAVDNYRDLSQVSEWQEDKELLAAALGGLCLLDAAEKDVRDLYLRRGQQAVFKPRRSLLPRDWEVLTGGAFNSGLTALWDVVAGTATKVLGDRLSEPSVMKELPKDCRLVRGSDDAPESEISAIAQGIGCSGVELYVGTG